MSCVCDYEAPRWYRSKIQRARKPYRCDECGSAILPGDSYERAVGMHDDVYSVATCSRCVDLRDFVKAHVPCFCWAHFNLHDDCLATADFYRFDAPGLMFGVYRRIKLAERQGRGGR